MWHPGLALAALAALVALAGVAGPAAAASPDVLEPELELMEEPAAPMVSPGPQFEQPTHATHTPRDENQRGGKRKERRRKKNRGGAADRPTVAAMEDDVAGDAWATQATHAATHATARDATARDARPTRDVPREDTSENELIAGDNNRTLDDLVEDANGTMGGEGGAGGVAAKSRIAYSLPWVNKTYQAKDDFNPRGMEHLYLITNLFLDLVTRDQEFPKELRPMAVSLLSKPIPEGSHQPFTHEDGMMVVGQLEANWDVLLKHYVGLVALLVLGVLMVVVMPLAGLLFACCRCLGRCGAQEPHYDKKRDPCKRATLGTLLATIVVVILLGLVCTFVTTTRVQDGLNKLPDDVRTSLHDTKLFLNNTDSEVQNLLVSNYRELQDVLFNKLDSSGELVKSELARVTKAVAIDNLTAIATSLSTIKQELWTIKNTTLQLQDQTSNLQSGLGEVALRLHELEEACKDLPLCQDLITQYADQLKISNEFDQLPNVESKLDEVTALIENDIEVVVKRGKRAFDTIATEIQNKVQRSIPEIKAKISDAGGQLEDAAESIHRMLQRFDDESPDVKAMFYAMEDFNDHTIYGFWAFMGLCILLLVITLCFTLGVVFGCCGRRQDEASSCHKATGASWLMCGVGLTFLFSALIMAVTTSLFLAGSLSEVMVCDPLADPTHSEVFSVVEEVFNLDQYYIPHTQNPPRITEIIRKCHHNQSLYSVLSLDLIESQLGQLHDYKNSLNLDEKIEQLMLEITVDTNVEILSRTAKDQLWELANSSVADKDTWDYYTDILEKRVLQIDLMELAALLNQTADQLPTGYDQVSTKLKIGAIFLEGLQRWVSSIGSLTKHLKQTTARLNEHLKFNKTSLREAIGDLISQAEFAQLYLRINGSREVTELVERFSKDFLADVDEYVLHVETAVERDVGRCGPLSTVYNATTSAVCKDIMYPFNGYWASVGWVFIFFIPAMILSVYLSSLYRKTEPYPGPLNESSGYDKKGRQRGAREYEGQVSSSYQAEQPYSSSRMSPPRIEYTNPTDWADYPPSGGPPRYSSQPNLSPEYERPPPYYYPGPGDA